MRLFVNILSYWLMSHVRFLLVRAYRCDWFWINKNAEVINSFDIVC